MKQEDQKREKWDNKVQAFLSLIGFAVGVANFWRFPYMCQKNGGGTFLIPYAVMTLIIGFPLTYIELLVGQKFQKGPLLAWGAISPYARGIGIASCICCCIGASYYAAVLGYSIFYFSNSFRSPLPWSQCPIIRNESNFTHAKVDPECSIAQPAVYYFYKETLDATHSINDGGGIYWKAIICLAAGWIILYFCLMQGIKSSGKVVYVTATLPYVFLIAFLVRGMTLPGHENGLAELIRPNITALRNPYVWKDAAAQIFYSLGGGFGAYIALGSYNPPQMKTARYAVSVVLINALTSLLAATVVFSILGSSATQIFNQCLKTASVNPATFNGTEYGSCSMRKILLSVSENKIPATPKILPFGQGPGLAFIAFSTVLQQFHGAQVWSALFFFMLFTMGIDSLFGIIEVVSTSIRDTRFFSRWPRQIVLALLCSLFFAIGLIVVQRSGGYYLEIADNHFIALALLVIAMSECIVVAFHDSYHRLA
ncbi:uncharacterized protein TRIADDRAFT_37598 [Trichoplax adhaerens]|uniref:Transporter n=1 Tax=Trichoplax adhaerens TaxID=10228 RepID=B3RVU1_TRIAD|nr:hypothetical protein TRIADDRAFT_37598 [Trichoplax adhaerens]EDV26055.1 hypothetical protein TRIADDRAFT_37598 [Trichoplax adhaerens]|eukprot:XP_002112088.1 hypothetical protein TRIADDRAFT_37598 [Trichoplax adhaerens]